MHWWWLGAESAVPLCSRASPGRGSQGGNFSSVAEGEVAARVERELLENARSTAPDCEGRFLAFRDAAALAATAAVTEGVSSTLLLWSEARAGALAQAVLPKLFFLFRRAIPN